MDASIQVLFGQPLIWSTYVQKYIYRMEGSVKYIVIPHFNIFYLEAIRKYNGI